MRAVARLSRSLAAALLAVRFFDELGAILVPGAFESIRVDLRIGYGEASAALVAVAPGAIVGGLFSVLADYRSRRAIAACGAAGYALALFSIAAASTFPVVLAGSFVIGLAATAMVDATEVALADVAGDDLERQLRVQNVWGSVGDLAGPGLLITVAALGLSWRVAFVAGGVLLAAYAIWLTTLSFPPPHPRADDHSVRSAVGAILRDPAVWLIGAVSAFLSPLDESLLAFLIADLADRGLTTEWATAIATTTIVGGFAGYVTLGRRPGDVSRDGALLAAAVTLLVVPSLPVTVVASFVLGLALIRLWIDLQARTLRLRPGDTGTVKSVVSVLECAGLALPLLSGAIADRMGVAAGLASFAGYAWLLVVAALLVVRRR